ncbi:PilW family protein [Shewanella septentrionalis]|uniref:PilW family protein n=1 Tax=Shewanella septentrionalis TaxID=2952223 RepID=A0A9X3AVI1_9GAMM|nr:PilW family protein [Shewanella septentrionalis]MCT7947537.1 PilW family protein [Shewanella septentrionalis]
MFHLNQVYGYQKGMSLVEIMVAMVIGLFLTLGVFTMFNMSSSNVTTTSQYNQLQENGRIALVILERDLSQLGFMGDITGTDFVIGSNATISIGTAVVNDCVGDGVNNASLPNNQPAHFRRLWGYENGVSSQSFACLSDVKAKTDVLQIKRLIGPPVEAADVELTRFYVSATSSEAVFFSGVGGVPALPNARIWEYQHHIYYIKNDADGIPVLRRRTLSTGNGMSNEELLVEGIENMRILYGFDNDGDDTPDAFMSAAEVTSLMWDNQEFQRLVALKVYILVRSIQEDRSYTNVTKYRLGDKDTNTKIPVTEDHFRRKVLSTTVVLENPVLMRN